MVQPLHAVLASLLPRSTDFLPGCRFVLVEFSQVSDGPFLELGRNLNTPEKAHDLTLQLLGSNAPLPARRVFLPTAVVVSVVKDERIGHVLDGGRTAHTGRPLTVGELEATRPAHELVLLLGGDAPFAAAAPNQAGEGKLEVRLGPGCAIAAQEHLHPVILRLGDHRLVLALIPAPAALGILKRAVVEGLGEKLVDGARYERLAAHPTGRTGAEPPLPVGDLPNAGRRVLPGEHQIPHPPDERKALRVFDDRVFARQPVGVVQVTHRSNAGMPAVLALGLEAPLHILAQVVHVFLGHAELDIHEDEIVILTGVALGRGEHLDALLLDGPDDRTAVHRVAGKAVELPTEDTGGLAAIQALDHLVEHGAARLLGGLRFDQHFNH